VNISSEVKPGTVSSHLAYGIHEDEEMSQDDDVGFLYKTMSKLVHEFSRRDAVEIVVPGSRGEQLGP